VVTKLDRERIRSLAQDRQIKWFKTKDLFTSSPQHKTPNPWRQATESMLVDPGCALKWLLNWVRLRHDQEVEYDCSFWLRTTVPQSVDRPIPMNWKNTASFRPQPADFMQVTCIKEGEWGHGPPLPCFAQCFMHPKLGWTLALHPEARNQVACLTGQAIASLPTVDGHRLLRRDLVESADDGIGVVLGPTPDRYGCYDICFPKRGYKRIVWE
jgi:hypothetical protein